jgi:hypothetical protein
MLQGKNTSMMRKYPFIAFKISSELTDKNIMIRVAADRTPHSISYIITGSLGVCVWSDQTTHLAEYIYGRLYAQDIQDDVILSNNYMMPDELLDREKCNAMQQIRKHINMLEGIIDVSSKWKQ